MISKAGSTGSAIGGREKTKEQNSMYKVSIDLDDGTTLVYENVVDYDVEDIEDLPEEDDEEDED
jgi:hypothetical protein